MQRSSIIHRGNLVLETPPRKNYDLTRSSFLTSSARRPSRYSVNPEDITQSFFRNQPFVKFQDDKVRLRPVSYESPFKSSNRTFVTVDEKVTYGAPISAAEFESLRRSRVLPKQEVITYGYNKPRERVMIEVRKEKARATCGCCGGCGLCGDREEPRRTLIQKYD